MARNVGSYAWYPSANGDPNWAAWYAKWAATNGDMPSAVSRTSRGERKTSIAAAKYAASPGRVSSAQPTATPPTTGHALDPVRTQRDVVTKAIASHIVAGGWPEERAPPHPPPR